MHIEAVDFGERLPASLIIDHLISLAHNRSCGIDISSSCSAVLKYQTRKNPARYIDQRNTHEKIRSAPTDLISIRSGFTIILTFIMVY